MLFAFILIQNLVMFLEKAVFLFMCMPIVFCMWILHSDYFCFCFSFPFFSTLMVSFGEKKIISQADSKGIVKELLIL